MVLVGSIVKIIGGMGEHVFYGTLEKDLELFMFEKILLNGIFQHDNDPKYNSRLVKQCHTQTNTVALKWPPQSLDKNVKENL